MESQRIAFGGRLRSVFWEQAPNIAVIVLVVGLLVYADAGKGTRLWADDYCAATSVDQQHGVLGAQVWWWQNWTGRYGFVFGTDLLTSLSPAFVPFFCFGLLAVWLTALYVAARHLGRVVFRRGVEAEALLFACMFLLALVEAMPNRLETLYWLSGAINYAAPLVVLTGLVALVARASLPSTNVGRRASVLSCLLGFLGAGFSESYIAWQAALLLLSLGLCLGLGGTQRVRLAKVLGAALAGAILGSIVVYLAPGNATRELQLPPHMPLYDAFSRAAHDALNQMIRYLENPAAWLLALASFALCFMLASPPSGRISWSRFAMSVIGALGAAWLLILAPFATGYYFLGARLPDRAWVYAEVSVLAALVFVAYRAALLASALLHRTEESGEATDVDSGPSKARLFAHVALLAFVLALMVPAAVHEVEHRGTVGAYASAWDQRDASIREARRDGVEDVTTFPIQHDGNLLDVTFDPGFWSNSCIAAYYRLHTIRAPVDY